MRRFLAGWVLLAALGPGLTELSAATVSGQVVFPSSDMGWQPPFSGMKVRVLGTPVWAEVNGSNGDFTLSNVPAGTVTLWLDEVEHDAFTAASKRVQVQVAGDVSGVAFNLVYHWKALPYPSVWGQPGYGQWAAHFASDQAAFLLFRVNGDGISPERMELYRTVDGGQHWQQRVQWTWDDGEWSGGEPYPDRDRSFYFLDAHRGVILATAHSLPCAGGVGFFYTTDGGDTWGYSILPKPTGAYPCNPHRYAHFGNTLIVAGTVGCNVQGYGGGFYDVIWESADAGASWVMKTHWPQSYGACTGLGAGADGSAVAFFTPYGSGERRTAVRNPATGEWQVTESDAIVTNSGYGPADVSFTGGTAWVRAEGGSLPNGLYRSDQAGAPGTWTKVSGLLMQYLDFATELKGFGTGGGPMWVTYNGGLTWLLQSGGGGYCCHGNDVYAFDATHAAWRDGGVGDPDATRQLFTYVEPWEPSFEIVPGVELPDDVFKPGDVHVPVGSYKLLNNGPVPVSVGSLTFGGAITGGSLAGINPVKLWLDKDAGGYVNAGDTLLAQGSFAGGKVALSAGGQVLNQYVPAHLLVTCDLAVDAPLSAVFNGSLAAAEVSAARTDTGTPVTATAPTGYVLVGRSITIGELLFADDFEGGLAHWSATTDDPVPDAGYGWFMSNAASASPAWSVRAHGDRNHEGNVTTDYLTLASPLNLTAVGGYRLTLNHRYDLDPSFALFLEASADGGSTWNWLGRYGSYDAWNSHSTGGLFVHEVIDLADYAGAASVLLRFRFDWTAGWYYNGDWWVDDVRVFRLPPAPADAGGSDSGGQDGGTGGDDPTGDGSGPGGDGSGPGDTGDVGGDPPGEQVADELAEAPPPAFGFCGVGLAELCVASALMLGLCLRRKG